MELLVFIVAYLLILLAFVFLVPIVGLVSYTIAINVADLIDDLFFELTYDLF